MRLIDPGVIGISYVQGCSDGLGRLMGMDSRMPLTDADVAAALAPAGVCFIERDRAAGRLPVRAAGLAPTLRREDGRVDAPADKVASVDDPDATGRLNAAWYRMAAETGLPDARREFLLAVSYAGPCDDADPAWVRVRLLEEWDIDGGGTPLLGNPGIPEFTALSLDGQVLMRTTLWGNWTVSSLAVQSPATCTPIRRHAERMADDPEYPPADRSAARTWLESCQQQARAAAEGRDPARPDRPDLDHARQAGRTHTENRHGLWRHDRSETHTYPP